MSDKKEEAKKKAWDEKLFKKYQAQEARRGTPSRAALTKRAQHAVYKGHWKTALAAVSAGADPDVLMAYRIQDSDIVEPILYAAIRKEQVDLVRKLVEKGADRTAVYRSGAYRESVFQAAAGNGSLEVLSALLGSRTDGLQNELDQALVAASRGGVDGDKKVKLLLDRGAMSFEEALEASESRIRACGDPYLEMHDTRGHARAIQGLIRVAAAERGVVLPPPAAKDFERMKDDLARIFDNASEDQRVSLLETLREKYASGFAAAAAPRTGPDTVFARQKPVLIM